MKNQDSFFKDENKSFKNIISHNLFDEKEAS